MKKILSLIAAFGVIFSLTSCSDDDDSVTTTTTDNEIVTGLISENTTWTSDKIYELAGRVVVNEGATLTIEAGTIIKGRTGSGSLASTLIVARGAKINAVGTASEPIIFTSILDDIEIGQMVGSNLTQTDNAKWGGLVILGAAPISAEDGDTEGSIEGIPADDTFGLYGGTASADNSGTLSYVSIRHGGSLIGEGNEINGLTLGGVGSGTTISNIEIFATLDDGIEFFGGTVNVSNALIYWQGDDGLDVDQNYSGTVDNFAVIHGTGVGTDEGMEVDGPEGSTNTTGLFTFKNGSVMNDGTDGSAADFKSKAQGTLMNVKFSGYSSAILKIRASYENNCADAKSDALTHLTDANATLKFTTTEFDEVSVYTASTDDSDVECTVQVGDQTAAEASAVSTTATGANMDAFSGWTAASNLTLL